MRISKPKQIRCYWNEKSNVYKDAQWTGSKIARFDYAQTKKALLRSLNPTGSDKILEIGCGPGTWTDLIASKCSTLVAIDISEKMIEKAKENIHNDNVTFINSDFMNCDLKVRFDKIFSVRVFEYISNKKEFFRKAYSLLNPDGELVIITKTKDSLWDFYKRLKKFLGFYHRNNFDEVRLYSWYGSISVDLVRTLLKSNKFSITNISPVIIRLPIFVRGNDEVPLIPKKLESIALRVFCILSENLPKMPTYVPFFLSESYVIHAIKNMMKKRESSVRGVKNSSELSISVVICTKNRRKALRRCVDSIVNQSCRPREIIIVDDASGRKTKEAINEIVNNCRIQTRLIVNEERIGSAASRNRGIRAAKFDIVAFLDDDCSADKDWLEELLKYYESELVVGVGGPVIELGRKVRTKAKPKKYMYISRSGNVVNNTRLGSEEELGKLDFKLVDFFQGGNMSYRKDVLIRLDGFDENFKGNGYREETDLGIRSSRMGVQIFNPNAYTFHYSAEKGGCRDFVKFNMARFLHWKIRNTCLLLMKHYSLLNALGKIKCQFEREIRGIAEGKPNLDTREKFYPHVCKLVSIIYVIGGVISGIISGFCVRAHRNEMPIDDPVDHVTETVEKAVVSE